MTIFLGDSIIAWNDYLNTIENLENLGIPGFTTTDIIWQLKNDDEEIISGNTVYLMIGVNDIMNRIPTNKIISNIDEIILKLEKRFKNIYFISLLPTDNLKLNKEVKLINKALKDNENITFLNLYKFFTDKDEKINYIYTTDGVHLNNYGYELFNKELGEIK